MTVLPDDTIRKVYAAVLTARIADKRNALLGGVDAAVLASLPTSPDPSSQVLGDQGFQGNTVAHHTQKLGIMTLAYRPC
jgi:hypothetical protein